jgi:hypothetical protein
LANNIFNYDNKFLIYINNHINLLSKTIVLIAFIASIVASFYILDRGFEITDESYYILLSMHPAYVESYISAQHWITSILWNMSGSLFLFRLSGMLMLITSAALLAFGIISTLSNVNVKFSTKNYHLLIISSSIISALLYGETINFSPCYNLLATSSAYASFGLLFFYLNTILRKNRIYLLVLIGIILSIEFISKPSSGISIFILILALMTYFNRDKYKLLVSILTILISLILFIVIFMYVNTTFEEAKISFSTGYDLFKMIQTETVPNRLERYCHELFIYFYNSLEIHFILLLSTISYAIFKNRVSLFIFISSIVYTPMSNNYFDIASKDFVLQMEFSFVILFTTIFIFLLKYTFNKDLFIIIFGLILLPFAVAIGSGNSIFTQIIISLAPWGIVIALLSNIYYKNVEDIVLTKLLFIVFIIVVSSQIFLNLFRIPYHMNSSYIAQSNLVYIKGLGNIKVDTKTSEFINGLHKAIKICKIPQKAEFYGMYNIPGVSLPLQSIPVSTPWLNDKAQTDVILKHNNKKHYHIVAIQLNNYGKIPALPQIMKPYDNKLQYCGAVEYPYNNQKIQIWCTSK